MPLDLSLLEEEPSGISSDMDIGFQTLIQQREYGVTKSSGTSSEENEVAVIALVTDHAKWEALEDVRNPVFIGREGDEGDIVTGRISVFKIEEILALEEVLEIEPSKPLHTELLASLTASEGRPEDLPSGTRSNGGEGVLVGIVDQGIDITHPNFRNPDGTTRVTELWDQAGASGTLAPYGYGQAYSGPEINQAFQTQNPFLALAYQLFKGENPQLGTHGTHVTDIAAGNGQGTGMPGYAPKADLMFVDCRGSNAWGPADATKGFGETDTVIDAVRYIFERSNGRPTVVNLSLGSHAGPHDGKGLIERAMDVMVDAEPNRAVVVSAGNSYEDNSHQSGHLASGQYVELEWVVPQEVPKGYIPEVQVWYPKDARMGVELYAPNGQLMGKAAPSESRRLRVGYSLGAFLASRTNQSRGRDNVIGVQLYPGMPGGVYKIRLVLESANDVEFHAWVERCVFQTIFRPPTDTSHTLGSLANGRLSIVVGAYDATQPGFPICSFSSSGPTRDGRQKPEVSAPGGQVLAALDNQPNNLIANSGTSMAAPAIAGIVALIFAEAKARNKDLSIHDVRAILEKAAQRNSVGGGWDPRFGHGRISAKAALEETISFVEEMAAF